MEIREKFIAEHKIAVLKAVKSLCIDISNNIDIGNYIEYDKNIEDISKQIDNIIIDSIKLGFKKSKDIIEYTDEHFAKQGIGNINLLIDKEEIYDSGNEKDNTDVTGNTK